MSIAHALLPEFDIEMANTRRALVLVPEADAAWKPHEKSYSLGDLALHLKNLTSWINYTLDHEELDLAQPWPPQHFRTTDLLVADFDAAVASARELLAGTDDAAFMVPWTLRKGDHVILTLPRIAVIRSFVMNHAIHHRAQLTVYLRLLDVPVPGLYGPSADES